MSTTTSELIWIKSSLTYFASRSRTGRLLIEATSLKSEPASEQVFDRYSTNFHSSSCMSNLESGIKQKLTKRNWWLLTQSNRVQSVSECDIKSCHSLNTLLSHVRILNIRLPHRSHTAVQHPHQLTMGIDILHTRSSWQHTKCLGKQVHIPHQ